MVRMLLRYDLNLLTFKINDMRIAPKNGHETYAEMERNMITEIFADNLNYFKPFLLPYTHEFIGRPDILALGAMEGETAIGALAVACPSDTLEAELLSVYISPDYRRKGHGGQLLEKAIEVLNCTDYYLLNCFYNLEDEDKKLLEALLKSNGFIWEEEGSSIYQVRLSQLSPAIRKYDEKGSGGKLIRLAEVPGIDLREFNQRVVRRQRVFRGLINQESYDSEISVCLLEEQKIAGCILISALGEQEIQLETAYYKGKDASALLAMLRAAVHYAEKKYKEDVLIFIPCVEETAQKLVNTISEQKAVRSSAFCHAHKAIY